MVRPGTVLDLQDFSLEGGLRVVETDILSLVAGGGKMNTDLLGAVSPGPLLEGGCVQGPGVESDMPGFDILSLGAGGG